MGLRKLFGPASILTLIISEVALIFTCYFVGALFIVKSDPAVFLLYHSGLARISILVGAIVVGLYFQDLYEDVQVPVKTQLVQQVCLALGMAFLLQALLNYADSRLVFPRWMMLAGSALALAAIPAWRVFYARTLLTPALAKSMLFLGATPLAKKLAEHFHRGPELGIQVIGYVGEADGAEDEEPVFGPLSDFKQIVEEKKPDVLVVALDEAEQRALGAELLDLRFHGQAIEDIAHTYETALRRVCVPRLRAASLVFSDAMGPRPYLAALQGFYSRVFAALGLLLSLPVMLAVALAVKVTSKGPVFYRQERLGLQGKPFTLVKFRSMRADAESGSGAVWAQKDDPRVTPIGRFMRRFRIDEIPQLYNALKGEMSIVGPRPERPEFVETLEEEIPFYRQRLVVKPGITGWAQISYKYGDSLEDTITKLEYDLFYVKSLTPMIDLYVMFHTVKVILQGRGAH